MSQEKIIRVAAAVIENSDGKILIAKRPEHVHQGGLWEFPGGKIESNESVEQALQRELNEELAIDCHDSHPLIQIKHRYPDKSVILHVRHVTSFSGTACGNEGQEIQWVSKQALNNFSFPAANKPIITAVQLPSQYLITPEHSSTQRQEFLSLLSDKVNQGASLIQLRAKNLSEEEFAQLYKQVQPIVSQKAVKLLPNCSIEQALKLNAHGVHLNARRLMQTQSLPANLLVAASCHNKQEIKKACTLGVQFIVVSPVNRTQSHPDSQPLGWENFSTLCETATVPVFALGGMALSDEAIAIKHGAQGIAAISSLWY